MDSVQPTPGPWEVINGEDDHDFSVSHDGDCDGLFEGVVASGYVVIGNPEMDELAIVVCDMNHPNVWDDALLDANVALIKAAPDLLEACIAVAASAMRNHAYDLCVAAITKAKGVHHA